MKRAVDSGVIIYDVFGYLFSNSTFSTDGVNCATYFVQPLLDIRVAVTSQTTHCRLLFPLQL